MPTINFSHKKLRLSLIAFLILSLSFVSIAFGTSYTKIIFAEESTSVENKQKSASEKSVLASVFSIFYRSNQDDLAPEAAFTVNNNGDSNDAAPGNGVCSDTEGNCTLRAAIQEANATAGIDEINFNFIIPASEIQLNPSFSSGELVITQGVTINGPGARLLTILGNSNTTADVISIAASATTVTKINGITVANSGRYGINNAGRLESADVAIKNNRTGIYNSGKLSINRAVIFNNSTGGILLTGSSTAVNISNTTVTQNTSPDNGGGINCASADVTLNNVTISNNSAITNGGGFYYSGSAAGINVRNTIVADNTAQNGPDIFAAAGASFVSRGNNLIGKSVGAAGFVNGTNSDKVGTIAAPINPQLGLLQNNGGQTDTRSLALTSPARDAGNMCVVAQSCPQNNPAVALNTDQRGTDFTRVYENGVDIGAFETFYPTPSINSLVPNNWGTGRGAFELVVNGSNFVANSIVKWNGQNRATTFVSNNQLRAQILTADVAVAGQYAVTVVNPAPNPGPSDPVNFTVANCSYSLNPTAQSISASGGSGSVTVTAQGGCAWSAASNVPWITISGNATGTGAGTLNFTVQPNTASARSGTLTIANQTFTVNQTNGCGYALSAATVNLSSGAGSGAVNLNTGAGCQWTATTAAPWISISSDSASGSGSKMISFSVLANTGAERTGTITVGGQTFTVIQAGGCTFSINPASQTFAAAGGTGSFTVATGSGCTFTPTASVSWITITGGNSTTVNFSVAANTSGQRTGTITVGGQTFTVNQASGCTFTLSPTATNFIAAGGPGSFDVTTNDQTCSWSAATTTSWITINGNSSRTGNGAVSFTVDRNPSPMRTGTITVNGQTSTVTQDNGCAYTLSSNAAPNVSAAGGTGTFNVNSGAGCAWTVASNAPWITITSSGNGTGTQTVNYSFAANIGPARSGTITAGGQTFTVTQESGCKFTLSATSVNIPASGGSTAITVTASNPGCAWTVVGDSSASWITANGGATGNGTVNITVPESTGPERSGTITVAGQTVTVTQVNGCRYALSPTSVVIDEGGGNTSFNVTTNALCSWTAQSSSSWIEIIDGGSGSGNKTITLKILANSSGIERTGTVTAGGQTFTVKQVSLRVSNLNDSGLGSLRQAIANANSSPTNDKITFLPTVRGTISLTSGEIAIANNGTLEIEGPGANALTITGGGVSRIFFINNANVIIRNVTLSGGNGVGVGSTETFKTGGAVYVRQGSAKFYNVNVTANEVISSNMPSIIGGGGGIYFDYGTNHEIRDSTISGNRSSFGGGIANLGELDSSGLFIYNSTISNNSAVLEGGGLYATGNTQLRNVTVSANALESANGTGAGIGVYSGRFDFGNTIIAENNGPEISYVSGAIASLGYNLIGDTPGDSQRTGGAVRYESTDILDRAPFTSALALLGGATPTVGLMPNSPAIDKGNNDLARSGTDQRGSARIINNRVDIGAFEHNIALTPPNTALPNGNLGANYGQQITANRIIATPLQEQFTYEIESGHVPGLSISDRGYISGIPTSTGFYKIAVKALGADGMYGINNYTISVGCSFSITPANRSFPTAGGAGNINVTTANGCNWNAVSNANWITLGSSSNGNGNGSVSFTIAPNSGASRTGTISVSGQTFTVTQSGDCSYSLTPTNVSIAAAANSGSFTVASGSGCNWTATSNAQWLSIPANGASGSGSGTVSYSVAANTGAARSGLISIGGQTFTVNQAAVQTTARRTAFDFDGDGKADISVFRPSNSSWYFLNSASGFTGMQFGIGSDKLVPADFDGDGKTDVSVFRDGNWYRINSSNNSFFGFQWGQAGDVPVPADYDGDSKADYAVFRQGNWYIFQSSNNQFRGLQFGIATDKPVAADYDGDGKTDVAVFRDGNWYWLQSSDNGFRGMQFGVATDVPVVGNYDDDGKADQAVFRNGVWYMNGSTAGFSGIQFGLATDVPAPADFDGDGKTDVSVFRDGNWYRMNSSNNQFQAVQFGIATDKPVQSAFVP